MLFRAGVGDATRGLFEAGAGPVTSIPWESRPESGLTGDEAERLSLLEEIVHMKQDLPLLLTFSPLNGVLAAVSRQRITTSTAAKWLSEF